MNYIFFKSGLTVVLIFFVFFAMDATAYEIEGNLCKCDSCEDCTNALHAGACSIVQLTRDLSESTMGKSSVSCIINPPFSDGKTFDCNNHKIERCSTCGHDVETYGVYLRDKKNMVVKNCKIINFRIGIGIYSSSDIKVINNEFSNGYTGVYLNATTKCDIENNVIGNMELKGIHLSWSNGNSIANNDVTGVSRNSATAIFLEKSYENLIKNNNASGKKETGIFLKESDNNMIEENFVNRCNVGIQIEYSSSNDISKNKGSNCQESTILLMYSSKNKISKNEANSNKKDGIQILRSNKNLITQNEIKNNVFSYGLSVEYSSDNNISENIILSNRAGIHSVKSKNFIFENKVCKNKEYDFDSSDWMESNGSNNYCDISGAWNDINASGCTKKCKCESNNECNDDEICENARCEKLNCGKIYEHKCVGCLNDSDCSKSEKCENNNCKLKAGFCSSNNDCKSDEKCENNKCVQLECKSNEKSEEHKCVPKEIVEEKNTNNTGNTNVNAISNANVNNISKINEKEKPKEQPQNWLPLILIVIIVLVVLYLLFGRKKEKTKTNDTDVKGKENKVKEVKGEKN